jgi:glutamate racemase
MIEAGELHGVAGAAARYIESLLQKDSRIDTILLGCTHYALIEDVIRQLVPPEIRVLTQGSIVAGKLKDYLRRHPEIEQRLDRSNQETFLTTAYSERIRRLGTQFFGKPILVDSISHRA